MGSRAEYVRSGGVAAALVASIGAGLSFLMGLQSLLSLQFLPSQMIEVITTLANGLGVSRPEVSIVFFASGLVWFPLGFAAGRVTA